MRGKNNRSHRGSQGPHADRELILDASNTENARANEPAETNYRYLFRYYAFPEKGNIHRLDEVLTHHKLFFPSPAKFNDPFDCRVDSLSFPEKPDSLRTYLNGLVARVHPEWPRQERRRWVKNIIHSKAYDKMNVASIKKSMQHRIYSHGVLCLSAVLNDLLMWSHYTNGHRGYCLGFDHNSSFFAKALPVRYSREYPKTNAIAGPSGDDVIPLLLTKSDVWSYEKEWRLFELHQANQLITYPEEALKIILLGCSLEEEQKLSICSLAAKMKHPPKILQAHRDEECYGLKFFPIEVKSHDQIVIPGDYDNIAA